jgi:glycosyltransferase involved in cell wall biosynthesis
VAAVRISVAITNFNYGPYVAAAIDSVLAQTRPAEQIVLIDDGSTDESRAVLKKYEDRILVVLTENRGVVAATNDILARCDGEVVALLDADDLMLPQRLATLAEIYEDDREATWVFHGLARVDRATVQSVDSSVQDIDPRRFDVRAQMAAGGVPLSTPASSGLSFRRSLVMSLLPIPADVRNQDSYLALAAMARGVGYMSPAELGVHGIHQNNRFATMTGSERERYIAGHLISVAKGYGGLGGDLDPLADALTARALFRTRLGSRLRRQERGRLYAYLASLAPRRKARVLRLLTRRLAFRLKPRLRG